MKLLTESVTLRRNRCLEQNMTLSSILTREVTDTLSFNLIPTELGQAGIDRENSTSGPGFYQLLCSYESLRNNAYR